MGKGSPLDEGIIPNVLLDSILDELIFQIKIINSGLDLESIFLKWFISNYMKISFLRIEQLRSQTPTGWVYIF